MKEQAEPDYSVVVEQPPANVEPLAMASFKAGPGQNFLADDQPDHAVNVEIIDPNTNTEAVVE